MCGITGIFHFDKQRYVNEDLLKKITNTLFHRGPDGEGYYTKNNVGLGHRRLSIIDVLGGSQPMLNENKEIAIVLNGEIYNYIELKKELVLKGYKFKTSSDTEVLLNSYIEWGIDCQTKLNGMWAFAIWDSRTEQLFISRDRIGEKPLHYAITDNSIIFGSEIKSVLSYGISKEYNFELLELYSVFKTIPAPYTFFKNVKKLMPGSFIIASTNGVKESLYWDLPIINEADMNRNSNEVYSQFVDLFEDSIKIRMRADVPFGAFLSGGLDSASIVASMSKYSDHPINTFNIGYSEHEFDESQLAKLVAIKFNTQHYSENITSDSIDQSLNLVVKHYDEPFGDSSAIPTGCVSKFAAKKVKMVLTGDGGDEVLSGYSTYQGIRFAKSYQKMPNLLQKTIPLCLGVAAKLTHGKIRYKLNRLTNLTKTSSLNFTNRNIEKQSKPDLKVIKNLFDPSIKQIPAIDYLNDLMQNCTFKDDFYKQMFLNFKFDLPNDYLVKVDRMSMAYSLEARLPFLDHRLVEFMYCIHKDIKMNGWERKSILRNTLAKQLPIELLVANKKGFRVPVREWFKETKGLNKIEKLKINNLFNSKTISGIIDSNAKGISDNGNLLWSLLVLDNILSTNGENQ
jgi:asparagine synthase (glutamine-hydrolysing)